ncbi:MAG TPA: biotin--[acetyl-CoA-carboxylase] ligase [Candidatus Stackebrandtia excrementipullorum]|nr:biotin--[acetyl-CoA-carboxylase] ligase [Candidatus Stackebrandtia excrementipullorum]
MTDRRPLDRTVLSQLAGTGPWTEVAVHDVIDSTNAEVARLARSGAAAGHVVTAEHQSEGRGRAERGWESPSGAGLAVSMLLRPTVPQGRWSWLPLLAGVALADAVGEVTGLDAALKWPNDLLLTEAAHKAAGILAEVAGGAVVLGVGLNVTLTRDELPRADTTSLRLAGATELDRTRLLCALVTGFGRRYQRWLGYGGDPELSRLRRDYRTYCHTLGRQVRVELPHGDRILGVADDIDQDGRLVVDTGDERIAVAAGDVHHVRLRH